VDAIHLPPGLTLPSAFGAPAAPLQVGQVVQALVLELIESDVFRLQLPQATIDVRSSVPLTPGNTITLAVKDTGSNARLAIYTDVPAMPSAARPASVASLAGRTPIGEAVVIGRTRAGQGTASPLSGTAQSINAAPTSPRTASEPAVLPSSSAPAPRLPELPIRTVTPDQAVTNAIQTAAPRQAGLAPLFADVARIAQAAEGGAPAVPAPVRKAAADVLSFRLPFDTQVSPADIKQAFVRSGILFEPKMAESATPSRDTPAAPVTKAPEGARPAPSSTPVDATPAPTPQNDLKAALLVLRQVLKAWAPIEPAAAHPVSISPDEAAPGASRAQTPAASLPVVPEPIHDAQAIRQIVSALAALPEELSPASALPASPMSADEATALRPRASEGARAPSKFPRISRRSSGPRRRFSDRAQDRPSAVHRGKAGHARRSDRIYGTAHAGAARPSAGRASGPGGGSRRPRRRAPVSRVADRRVSWSTVGSGTALDRLRTAGRTVELAAGLSRRRRGGRAARERDRRARAGGR